MSEELVGAAATTCRYAVAFVFLTAALPKLVAGADFERAVANYALLPHRLVSPVARWLPRLELACAVLLLLGLAVIPVAAVAGVLLTLFSLAVAVNLVRGRRISCGCFSTVAPRRIGWGLAAADVGLAGMAAIVVLADPGVLTVYGTGAVASSSLSPADGLAALMLAAVLVLTYQLGSNWHSARSAARRLAIPRGIGA